MSSTKRRIPSYLLHKSRNLAKVNIEGKTHYLGTYGSEESKAKYRQLVGEWLDQQQDAEDAIVADTRLCELIVV